jgi:hypothetical protein
MDSDSELDAFFLSRGGPFYDLQRRLRMLEEDGPRIVRRAIAFVVFAWFVPLLLSLFDQLRTGEPTVASYLSDPAPWARGFVAIAFFLFAELQVERTLHGKLAQFRETLVLPSASAPAAAAAVSTALRRRDSGLAEFVCLVLAYVIAFCSLARLSDSNDLAWATTVTDTSVRPTLAGLWGLFVTLPLF